MKEELKACPHGRNFCMECHYDPSAPRSTLPEMYDALMAENAALRAQLPIQGGEAVSVVGIRISTDGFGSYIADSTMGIGPAFPGEVREPLMTVAQHNRIIAAITAHPATGVIVSRWQVWVGEAFYGAFQDVVLASDYDRLEQECKDAKCQAELMQRAAEVFREDRDAALKQVEGLRAALEFACKSLAQITSSDGSGHADISLDALRIAGVDTKERVMMVEEWKSTVHWRLDAALSAKP